MANSHPLISAHERAITAITDHGVVALGRGADDSDRLRLAVIAFRKLPPRSLSWGATIFQQN